VARFAVSDRIAGVAAIPVIRMVALRQMAKYALDSFAVGARRYLKDLVVVGEG
jgi:hypothetical protein